MDKKNHKITYFIKDFIVLLFYRLFSVMPLSDKERREHLERNIKVWNNYKTHFSNDKYIEHQSALTDFAYGRKHNADYNSCEIIAVYNTLKALGTECDFPDLITYFEQRGITCLGAFGTSPFSLIKYLRTLGCNIIYYNYKKWLQICSEKRLYHEFTDNHKVFIFMTYNNANSIRDMIHTMCVTKEDGYYKIHNDYEGSKDYPTLLEAVEGYRDGKSRMILIMGIK